MFHGLIKQPITTSNRDNSFSDKISDTSIHHYYMWIDQCIKSHEQCKGSDRYTGPDQTDSTLYPTRVIDVGTNPPRLCLTKDVPPGVRYATLSHCWGTSYSEKQLLKHDRIEAFRHGLPMSDLAKTFREAMFFTQKVLSKYDIRYL